MSSDTDSTQAYPDLLAPGVVVQFGLTRDLARVIARDILDRGLARYLHRTAAMAPPFVLPPDPVIYEQLDVLIGCVNARRNALAPGAGVQPPIVQAGAYTIAPGYSLEERSMMFAYDGFLSRGIGALILDKSAHRENIEWESGMNGVCDRAARFGRLVIAEATAIRDWISLRTIASKVHWSTLRERQNQDGYYQPGDRILLVECHARRDEDEDEAEAYVRSLILEGHHIVSLVPHHQVDRIHRLQEVYDEVKAGRHGAAAGDVRAPNGS